MNLGRFPGKVVMQLLDGFVEPTHLRLTFRLAGSGIRRILVGMPSSEWFTGRFHRVLVTLVCLLPILAGGGGVLAQAVVADDPPDAGLPRFVLSDFGGVTKATLETNALPYKVVATALLLREERVRGVQLGRADLPAIYRQFGFLTPERIANWPADVALPRFERPVGTVTRELRGPTALIRIDAVNLGCATCHAGVMYDAQGRPTTNVVWGGMPNSSINLEAYSQAVVIALASASNDRGAFRARIAELFPEMGRSERFTLRYLLLPRVAKRITQLRGVGAGAVPFSNGGAGRTNGVATLKLMLGVPVGRETGHTLHGDVGFTSIPDLSGLGLRTSLLYDGIYAPIGAVRFGEKRDSASMTRAHLDSLSDIAAFFTVSTMGVRPDASERVLPAMRPTFRWLATKYTTPVFPGTIDTTRTRAGESIFTARCARCHGTYGDGAPRRLVSFPNALIPGNVIRTDSARWAMVDSTMLARLAGSAYGRHMTSMHTGGYVPPILSGVWATAPYLHNGSVPTIWQLLTPSERPVRFLVGGHELDFTQLGIAGVPWTDGTYRYPAGYVPWSIPELVDTQQPGMSNAGHERQGAGLSREEKLAVIEYLKTL